MPHHVAHHHHAAHEPRDAEAGVATEVSVVYVTAAPTFAGPIGSYSTPTAPQVSGAPNFNQGGGANVQNAPLAANAGQGQQNKPAPAAPESPSSMIMAPSSSIASSALPSSIQSQTSSAVSSAASTMVPVNKQQTSVAVPRESKPAPESAQTSAPAAPVASGSSGGLSGGSKAAIAVVVTLFGLVLIAMGVFYYRRRHTTNKGQKQQLDNEKSNQPPPVAPMAATIATAPRLSLKPSNDSLTANINEKQAAAGGLEPVAAPTARGRTPEPQASTENEKSNPFGDHAKVPTDSELAPKPLNISRPSTPTQGEKASPETNDNSGAAPTPNAAPESNGPVLNVHRVLLDFAPGMNDELGLTQGHLVRMLHEYDDGWCLCIRLDRSQQGVVPRSCISKLPVKPRPPPGQRPKGPPPSNSRPGTPQSTNGATRARASSNASKQDTVQGPFGEGQYRAEDAKKQSPTYEESLLSNSPSQSPPSSPEQKQGPVPRKPAPGSAV